MNCMAATSTVQVKTGWWPGPDLRVWYTGRGTPARCAFSWRRFLQTPDSSRIFESDCDEVLVCRSLRAISAAACSACRSVGKYPGLSKISPLKFTAALNFGAWSGPSLIHEYEGIL